MDALQVFNFRDKSVRAIVIDGAPWFVAVDVLDILGLTANARHLDKLDADEKGVNTIHTPGGPQQMNVVNESGVYGLTFRSRKPEAKAFRKWTTSEVLPSLRRTGKYAVPGDCPPVAIPSGLLDKINNALERVAPTSRCGELSNNGLPRDRLTRAYWRAGRTMKAKRPEAPGQQVFSFAGATVYIGARP